jgi:AraC-like DNA-binding protein
VRDRLLAKQIAGSRYVLHDLAPARNCAWTLALAGREECARDYCVDRANYPFHVVELVATGRGSVRLDDGPEQAIGPGAAFAYEPRTRCVLRTDPATPLVKFFFALAGREVPGRLAAAALTDGTVRRLVAPAGVLSVAEDVIREGQRHGPHAKAICLKLVELLLLKIADAAQNCRTGDDRALGNFLRCKALIEARAGELRSLEEVADSVGLDGSSICRLFRRFQGTSPYQFLLRRKMMIAAEFLVDTGARVSDAAEHVGFNDPFHFARCFKAVHGVPPSEVRRYRTAAPAAST